MPETVLRQRAYIYYLKAISTTLSNGKDNSYYLAKGDRRALIPFLFLNNQNQAKYMRKSNDTLIMNSVLLKAAKKMDLRKFAFYGSLSIPFCTSSKIYKSEFQKLMSQTLGALNQADKQLYWILNYVPGDESINSNGNIVISNSTIYFVLSDVIDSEGASLKKHRDDIYNLINALWHYEIEGLYRMTGDVSLEYALGIKTLADGFGVDNVVFMSADLMANIFIEHAKDQEGIL